MQIIAFIVVGWVTALLSQAILPSSKGMGLIRTLLVGMVGGMSGGGVGGTFNTRQPLFELAAPSLLGSFLGALVAVFVVTSLNRQRAHV